MPLSVIFGLNLTDSETYRGEMIYMWLAGFYWKILETRILECIEILDIVSPERD